jgi:hypothetical protein
MERDWLATGLRARSSISVSTVLAYSDNGSSWSRITLPGITFSVFLTGLGLPLPQVNSIWTDDSYWYVLIKIVDFSSVTLL